MSDYAKDEYVVATADGAGDRASGRGRVVYRKGDEFTITAVFTDHLNVRMSSGGPVFRVTRGRVSPPLG